MSNHGTATLSRVWEDLVNDFLEIACFLRAEERDFLVKELGEPFLEVEEIHAYPTFLLGKTVIAVCDENGAEECWLYYPKTGKIVKFVRKKKQ